MIPDETQHWLWLKQEWRRERERSAAYLARRRAELRPVVHEERHDWSQPQNGRRVA